MSIGKDIYNHYINNNLMLILCLFKRMLIVCESLVLNFQSVEQVVQIAYWAANKIKIMNPNRNYQLVLKY